MNDTLKRRLVGLLVLLVLVFVLSWLLPENWPESGEKGVPSTSLPLTANGVDGSASGAATEPAAPADASATSPAIPSSAATPAAPSVASAAPAHAGALPESVDSVDSSAPPLSEAPTAPPAPKPAAVAPPPKPAVAVPAPAATAKPEVKAVPKPPEPKLAQSLQSVPKPAAPIPAPPKPVAPPPVPAAPKLAAVVPPPPPPIVSADPAQAKLWFVQIGSFADQGNAQTTLNLLQNIGYRGESKQITSATGSALYRVRLGPFPSEAVAQQAFDKVSHQGYPQARVVSEPGVVKH